MSRFPGSIRLLAIYLCCLGQSIASPNTDAIAKICESAAEIASSESGVPLDVLRSIALTETGRNEQGTMRPWPWTVNMEGVGKWFDNVVEAQRYVDQHFQRGARSFDIGCFQINYRWHGQHFKSVQDMFDPITNARYAAKFLTELFAETQDWSRAAGAYHSRTPKYSKKYRARFDRIRAGLPPSQARQPRTVPPQSLAHLHAPRKNRFPLLQSSGRTASPASLVRMDEQSRRLIDLDRARPLLDHLR